MSERNPEPTQDRATFAAAGQTNLADGVPAESAQTTAYGAVQEAVQEPVQDDAVEIPLAPDVRLGRQVLMSTNLRPIIMGVVNVTPDSFGTVPLYVSDHPESAIAYAMALQEAGADIIDIGAESTRPGALAVDDEEQMRRLLPVVRACVEAGMVVSVDTRSPAITKAMLDEGVHLINDVSGLADPEVARLCANYEATYVLMHTRSTPDQMQTGQHLVYPEGIVNAVDQFFHDKVGQLLDLGLDEDQIIIDPGFGFAKTPEHNYELMRNLLVFTTSGLNVLTGVSRKSFIGLAADIADPLDRDPGSTFLATYLAMMGSHIHRVHDVAGTLQAMRTMLAIEHGGPAGWPEVFSQL